MWSYLAFHSSLFHPDSHLPVVKHTLQIILETKELLGELLIQSIDFVL